MALDCDRRNDARAAGRHVDSRLLAIGLESKKWSVVMNRIYEITKL